MKSSSERTIRLQYSEFGPLKSLDKLDQLGNLTAEQIRIILQLNLRIRNTDLYLKHIAKNETLNQSEIDYLERRMNMCIDTAQQAINSIIKNRQSLAKEWKAIIPKDLIYR